MSFEVSYYNTPNWELGCQFSHTAEHGSHLYLAGPPVSAVWRRVQAKLSRLEREEDSHACSPVVWLHLYYLQPETPDQLGLRNVLELELFPAHITNF